MPLDETRTAGETGHLADHNTLHAWYNNMPTFVATTARQPFSSLQTITSNPAGTTDKVAHILNTTITGNFSGVSGGSNPSFAWGLNVFTNTGTAANDGNAANLQNLIETNVGAASGTVTSVFGLFVEAAFFGAASGATVTTMASLRVGAPKRKDGATAGNASSAYGIFVEDTQAVGGGSAFAIFVEGGTSRFNGRVDITDTIANNGAGDTSIYAGFSTSDGGAVKIKKTADGGHVTAQMGTTNAEFQIHNGTAVQWSVLRTGLPKWITANTQTTVGAAGGASALPATPVRYLKVVDGSGTTLVVPAYTA